MTSFVVGPSCLKPMGTFGLCPAPRLGELRHQAVSSFLLLLVRHLLLLVRHLLLLAMRLLLRFNFKVVFSFQVFRPCVGVLMARLDGFAFSREREGYIYIYTYGYIYIHI